ncbi:hypothetical protein B0H66DRAFT_638837 [Apodospora peruviana]|uniref:Guanine nucleotide-exchange factor SEC12 n=1 Tax=Apodospora peruviana TaxID=516989 RepID=A0AAE0ICV2_9PEZI|nr:hypothetical protein B0H66DRAFT_638837 [Apodospora peruviana]
MAPKIPKAELRLSFPPYACDFDPQDANRLVVGGGGGPGRSGVSNKIEVLDASHHDTLQVVSEVDLSRDEDSVNTIAVAGPRRKNSIIVYAGINSSVDDIKKGKNEHFRVFGVDQPAKAKAATGLKITELSRSSLFTSTANTEAYQRLLRISPYYPGGSRQIGAVATGEAKDAQIVIFDVPPTGGSTAPKTRGTLQLDKQAVDLDLFQIGDDEWQLIYCTDYDLYTMNIGGKNKATDAYEPHCVFTMPHDDGSGLRPTFRSIRYLTSTFVMAAANLPKAGGAILQGFRLPAKPGAEGKDGWARLAIAASLRKPVTRATGMAVRNLSPSQTPTTKQGDAQFAIAVSGQDSSITVFTVDHQVLNDITLVANLYSVATFREVHPAPISGLAFSHFSPPKQSTMRPQFLKLASIGSMGNTCVVHSLPLQKYVDSTTPTRRGGPPRQPRYIMALKGRDPLIKGLVTFFAIAVVVVAILAQGFLEVKGVSRSIIGARSITPKSWHSTWKTQISGTRQRVGNILANDDEDRNWLADALWEDQQIEPLTGEQQNVIFVGDEGGDVKMEKHDEEQDSHKDAREWRELPPAEKEAWKAKLKKAGKWAGHWGEEVGDAVFKGVLFGQIGGAIGAIVGG